MSDHTLIALSREVAALTHERDRLAEDLERERLRLVACMTAAVSNTRRSAANRITSEHPYWSASYHDVCRAVDREMDLRERVQALDAAASWQPIATAPKDEAVIFWIVPKPPDEAYTNSSGKPIVGVSEPYAFRGKWNHWSALSKATHWRREPLVAPPAASRREEEK